MDCDKDLYKVLGVTDNAQQSEIKKAFRTLSMKHHPDRNEGSLDSTSKFQEISEAYDILSDPQQKRMYDLQRQNPQFSIPGMSGMAGMAGMSGAVGIPPELFEMLSGGLFGSEMPQVFHMSSGGPVRMNGMSNRPPPIEKTIEISLEEAFTGKTKQISVSRTIHRGASRTIEKETLYISIPGGIDSNEIITIKDKGNISHDVHGDVKVVVIVKNFTKFDRQGIDLIFQKDISLREALCGFTFDMNYIDGRTFKINNNRGNIISSGYKKIIPKMGMSRDGHRGDLIINFEVIFPSKLERSQIEAISEIL